MTRWPIIVSPAVYGQCTIYCLYLYFEVTWTDTSSRTRQTSNHLIQICPRPCNKLCSARSRIIVANFCHTMLLNYDQFVAGWLQSIVLINLLKYVAWQISIKTMIHSHACYSRFLFPYLVFYVLNRLSDDVDNNNNDVNAMWYSSKTTRF